MKSRSNLSAVRNVLQSTSIYSASFWRLNRSSIWSRQAILVEEVSDGAWRRELKQCGVSRVSSIV